METVVAFNTEVNKNIFAQSILIRNCLHRC